MKLLLKYVLLVSLLLMGRYEYLYAFTENHGSVLTVGASHPDKGNQEKFQAVEVSEDDDDKLHHLRKFKVSNGAIPYSQHISSTAHLLSVADSDPPLCICISFITPHKYILFGAFKI